MLDILYDKNNNFDLATVDDTLALTNIKQFVRQYFILNAFTALRASPTLVKEKRYRGGWFGNNNQQEEVGSLIPHYVKQVTLTNANESVLNARIGLEITKIMQRLQNENIITGFSYSITFADKSLFIEISYTAQNTIFTFTTDLLN